MTLQVHPIALGCMLVVAVGTLIYTYVTSRQQAQEQGYRDRPHNAYEDPPSFDGSRSSSWSSLTEDKPGRRPLRHRKKEHNTCSICLAPLKSALKTLTCEHVFHSNCITMWLNNNPTCPLCRKVARD